MEYLKSAGIEFPPGSEAHFEPTRSRLVIHSTDEVIAKVAAIVEEAMPLPPRQVQLSVGVAEFSLPDTSALPGLTYEKARALAGDSWRVLERTTLMTKSGQKSSGFYSIASGALPALPTRSKQPANPVPEPPSETFEVAPQIESDDNVSVEFVFNCPQPAGQTPKRFDAVEKVVLRNGEPALLHATTLPPAGNAKITAVRALIARARIVDARGQRPPPKPELPPPSHHP